MTFPKIGKAERTLLIAVAAIFAILYVIVAKFDPTDGEGSLAQAILGGESKESVLERITGGAAVTLGIVLSLILLRLPAPIAAVGAVTGLVVTGVGRLVGRIFQRRDDSGLAESLCVTHGGLVKPVYRDGKLTGAICRDGTLAVLTR